MIIQHLKSDYEPNFEFCPQMEDIVIPMLRGNMEDIAAEGGDTFEESSNAPSSLNATQQMYDRESRCVVVLSYDALFHL